ncbi:MAG: hypothetical protein HRK26_04215 [Rickettsiaceae bacterium H1]|nr:hypothetical protein [Rickettsiaceae bacterium H1]
MLSRVIDPNYKYNFKIKKMVVLGFGMPISERKELENTLEKSIAKYDVEILRGLEILPPTRNYSDQELYKIARSKGADTLLIISVDGRKMSKKHTQHRLSKLIFSELLLAIIQQPIAHLFITTEKPSLGGKKMSKKHTQHRLSKLIFRNYC